MAWFPCCRGCKVFDSAPWDVWTGGIVTGDTLLVPSWESVQTNALAGTGDWHRAYAWLRLPSAYYNTPGTWAYVDAVLRIEAFWKVRVLITPNEVQILGRNCAPFHWRQPGAPAGMCESLPYLGGFVTQAQITGIRCNDQVQFIVHLLDANGDLVLRVVIAAFDALTMVSRTVEIDNVNSSPLEVVEASGWGDLSSAPSGRCHHGCISESIPCDPPDPCELKRFGYQYVLEVSGFPAEFTISSSYTWWLNDVESIDCPYETVVRGYDQLNGTYLGTPRAVNGNPCGPFYVDSYWVVGQWTAERFVYHPDGTDSSCPDCRNPAPLAGNLFVGIKEYGTGFGSCDGFCGPAGNYLRCDTFHPGGNAELGGPSNCGSAGVQSVPGGGWKVCAGCGDQNDVTYVYDGTGTVGAQWTGATLRLYLMPVA